MYVSVFSDVTVCLSLGMLSVFSAAVLQMSFANASSQGNHNNKFGE